MNWEMMKLCIVGWIIAGSLLMWVLAVVLSAAKVQVHLTPEEGFFRATGVTKEGFTFEVWFSPRDLDTSRNFRDTVWAIRCWCFRRGAKVNFIDIYDERDFPDGSHIKGNHHVWSRH